MAYDIKNTKVIYLGRQGENLARTIEIDVSSMLMKWPDATISLLVQRNQEDTFYLAPVVIENGILKWTITNADTEIAGIGKIEVRAIQDDAIMKSATMKICVENSLGGTETDIPDPVQTWVDTIVAASEQAKQSAEGALASELAANEAAESITGLESNIKTAEAARVEAEKGRAAAESERVAAEKARAEEFAGFAGEITQLKDDIADQKETLSEITEIQTERLVGAKTNGKTINYTQHVVDAVNSFYVVQFGVHPGDRLTVNGTTPSGGYLFIYVNSAGDNVSVSEKNETGALHSYNDYASVVPETAVSIIVTGNETSSYTQVSVDVQKSIMPSGVKELQEFTSKFEIVPMQTEFVDYVDVAGKFINYKAIEMDANSSYHIAVVENINPDDTLIIKGQNNGTNYKYAFYDAYGNLISGEKGDGTGLYIFDAMVKVPIGAVKLIVNWNTSNSFTAGAVIEKVLRFSPNTHMWQDLTWVCLGDSLTATNSASNKHYFDYISERTGIKTVNMGQGGTGYWAENASGNAFFQRAQNIPACDIVTIFGSGNDLKSGFVLGDYTDTGTNTVAGCINTTLDVIFSKYPAARVAMISSTPWGGNPTTSPNNNLEKLTELEGKIAAYRGVPFLDLYHASGLRPQDSAQNSIYYSSDVIDGYSDTVHPNNKGQKFLYPHFMAFLETMI